MRLHVVNILSNNNNKIYLKKLRTFYDPNYPRLLVHTPKYKNLFSLTLKNVGTVELDGADS